MITDATRDRFSDLAAVVEGDGGDDGRWLVLTHDNPDPDVLASASVLARLLQHRFGSKVTCAYGGIVGRAENREMVRLLKLEFSHLRYLTLANFDHFALVDTQPRTGNNQLPKNLVPDLVFDHHPLRRATQSAAFFDVPTDYGATATLLSEYMEAGEVEPTRALATAMVYAIRSETQDFRRESAGPDKRLYDELLPRINKRDLAKIQFSRQPLAYFESLHQALENLYTVDTLIVSHLAEVEQPDIVPEVADLLLASKADLVAGHRHLRRLRVPVDPHHQRAARRRPHHAQGGRGNGKEGGHG